MEERISHRGTVVGSEAGSILVEIVSEAACSSCRAAGLCGMSESRKKIVKVPSGAPGEFLAGEEVEVSLARKKGLKAVLLSYAVPVMILLILILSLSFVGLGELESGALSLAGVGLYYLVLYLFRHRLSEGYEFYIKR